jgi:hypothetical protein
VTWTERKVGIIRNGFREAAAEISQGLAGSSTVGRKERW